MNISSDGKLVSKVWKKLLTLLWWVVLFVQMSEIQQVLVTETSHDQQYYVGHNKFYDQVSSSTLQQSKSRENCSAIILLHWYDLRSKDEMY